jgi:hypothetical protein
MDTIQATLGQALLVLIALAVVLFTLILLLVEADQILRLSGKLIRRWKSSGADPDGKSGSKHPHDGQEAR